MNNLDLETLLKQWYERTQEKRIKKGFVKAKSIQEIWNNENLKRTYADASSWITSKQVKLFQAIFYKKCKEFYCFQANYPIFLNTAKDGSFTDETIVVRVYQNSNGAAVIDFKRARRYTGA
jgi:hypothetical protein